MINPTMIALTIPGPPVGKQRPYVCHSGHTFTPQKTVNYEALIKQTFAARYPDFVPMKGPVKMTLLIYLLASKKDQAKMKKGDKVYATVRPDISNVLKSIEDALTGLAYVDDKLIVEVVAKKILWTRPLVEVFIQELP